MIDLIDEQQRGFTVIIATFKWKNTNFQEVSTSQQSLPTGSSDGNFLSDFFQLIRISVSIFKCAYNPPGNLFAVQR